MLQLDPIQLVSCGQISAADEMMFAGEEGRFLWYSVSRIDFPLTVLNELSIF